LGVIYENRGDLEKALNYFEKAKNLDRQNDIAHKNYERVNSRLVEKQQEDKKFQDGLELFKGENSYIQNKFLTFCGHRREDGLIVCPYRQLPQFLGMSAQRSPDVIKDWLDKKYIQKIVSPDPNVSSSVYKVNPYLEEHLLELQKGLEKEKELLEICQNLNTKSLDLIGYNEILERQLEAVILNKDLKELLKRDLKENALAIVTKSYKSALVLSGSIIEAILLDRLHSVGVKKTQIQKGTKSVNKKLEELDLNELLDAAKNNNLIDDNLLHLSHGVRGFRNLIHPGVEQRKKGIKISEENVMLAWTIVKKVLFEIK
jgi:tetratricopeptide (TPR) repeat protein